MTAQAGTAGSDRRIRVLLVDDQAIVRKGIRALLAEIPGIEVVGEAANGEQAVSQAAALDPDVTVMDLAMEVMDGIEAIRQITERDANARILVLTSFSGESSVFPAIKAGALGYLLKDSEPSDLILAIEQVSRGEPSLHPKIAIQLLQELRRPPDSAPVPDALTPRRGRLRQVARLNRDIVQVGHDRATIKTHVSSILSVAPGQPRPGDALCIAGGAESQDATEHRE